MVMSKPRASQVDAKQEVVVVLTGDAQTWAADLLGRLLRTAAAEIAVRVADAAEGTLAVDRRDSSTSYVVVYDNPRDALAASMGAGAVPSMAAREQFGAYERILSFRRQDRGRCVLLDAGELAIADIRVLASGLGASLGHELSAVQPVDSAPVRPDPLLRMVAIGILARYEWLELIGELEASRLPLLAEGDIDELDQLYLAYREARGLAAGTEPVVTFVTTADDELRQLRDQLALMRDQIAAIYTSNSWRVTAPIRRVTSLLGRRG
jgi:hypothetical protein